MMPVLALMLAQAPLTAGQIHAEDAKVIEAALVAHWATKRRGSGGFFKGHGAGLVYYRPVTAGPGALGDAIVQGFGKRRKAKVDPVIQKSVFARNAAPVSLAWFRPSKPWLKPFTDAVRKADPWQGQLSDNACLLLPGYSADRTRAILCYSTPMSPHTLRGTVWLEKKRGIWKVADEREEWYP